MHCAYCCMMHLLLHVMYCALFAQKRTKGQDHVLLQKRPLTGLECAPMQIRGLVFVSVAWRTPLQASRLGQVLCPTPDKGPCSCVPPDDRDLERGLKVYGLPGGKAPAALGGLELAPGLSAYAAFSIMVRPLGL